MTALAQANAEQRAASDPEKSAFVAASAGSGKTKLLTDRLLRLMLAGTKPEKILCLTYTKAAAAEMAIRLNRRLGEWVVLSDIELDAKLAELDVPRSAAARDIARKLFADVLDLAGGMKIGTIHAFCQSVLRRFPLEAALSPHFVLEEDAEIAARLRESREAILARPDHRDAIFALAENSNEQDFAALIQKFAAGDSDMFTSLTEPALRAMQRAALAADELDEAAILRRAVTGGDPALRAALEKIAAEGPAGASSGAAWRLDWLAEPEAARIETWGQYVNSFFGKDKGFEITRLVGPSLSKKNPHLVSLLAAEQMRVGAIEEARAARALALLNQNFLAVARPILLHDNAQKTGQASVTYADLIAHTLALLKNPDDVAWILYKLDGGIDHLLLDEVQDTAPAQWEITNAIAAEFFAGRGAREQNRTIFAVGDPKQSIFSFQGADLASFTANRGRFRRKVEESGRDWLDGKLSVSFRSTGPVLSLVDQVFAAAPACEGVCPPRTLAHGLTRGGQAGKVTLWPLTQAQPASPVPPWSVPDAYEREESSKTGLAKAIAAHIHAELAGERPLPSRGRAVTPGDFLILVRHRDEFLAALTTACKAAGIPIAGADRMVLTQQPAVTDILALCDALLLPEDDLAFAHFLASPLGGLSDESLMQLALGRRGGLAEALFRRRDERADWSAASELFHALLPQTDFLSPHALIARILHAHGGRARCLARLGPECAEPLDELLAEAQAFSARAPAALQSFLFTLRQSGASIRREPEAAGDVVRIMTVHGAKGLQAPIVILPDTTSLPNPRETLFLLDVPQQDTKIPIFCPRAELRSQAVADAAAAAKQADLEEYNRLLYVALTRAEDELLIAGAQGAKAPPANCWYNAVLAGFQRLGVAPDERGVHSLASQQAAEAPDRMDRKAAPLAAGLPAWAGAAPDWRPTPPAAETARPEPLAPSRAGDDPEQAEAASPLAGRLTALRAARESALSKGRAVHALLQHLPDLPAGSRRAAGEKYLASAAFGLSEAARASIIAAIEDILRNPSLAPLFGAGSRAETPIAGVVGDVEIGGLVDRLAVTDTAIHIADYKTNRVPPETADDIPAAYVRQLAAYAAILRDIYPGLPVYCTLIWTETAMAMPVPEGMLKKAALF